MSGNIIYPGDNINRKREDWERLDELHLTISEFIALTESIPDREWYIDQLLPRNQVMIVFGDPFEGKSMETQKLAIHFATGTPYHGLDVRKCKALYITWEGSVIKIGERFEKMLSPFNILKEDQPYILKLEDPIPINDKKSRDYAKFRNLIQEYTELGVELIIIDSLPWVFKGDINKDVVFDHWWANLTELIYSFNITTIFIAECRKRSRLGKGSEEKYSMDRLKGTARLQYKPYSILQIGKERNRFRNSDSTSKDNREWKDINKLVIHKSKDAQGAFEDLTLTLDVKTLSYNGQHWAWNDLAHAFVAEKLNV